MENKSLQEGKPPTNAQQSYTHNNRLYMGIDKAKSIIETWHDANTLAELGLQSNQQNQQSIILTERHNRPLHSRGINIAKTQALFSNTLTQGVANTFHNVRAADLASWTKMHATKYDATHTDSDFIYDATHTDSDVIYDATHALSDFCNTVSADIWLTFYPLSILQNFV